MVNVNRYPEPRDSTSVLSWYSMNMQFTFDACTRLGTPLTDIGKIRFTGHVIGPECAKHPELFPCRHGE